MHTYVRPSTQLLANYATAVRDTYIDGYNTKGARAHTHRELIREWLWEPNGHT